jgi:hypothetical protein
VRDLRIVNGRMTGWRSEVRTPPSAPATTSTTSRSRERATRSACATIEPQFFAVLIEKMGWYAAMREHRMDCAKYTR